MADRGVAERPTSATTGSPSWRRSSASTTGCSSAPMADPRGTIVRFVSEPPPVPPEPTEVTVVLDTAWTSPLEAGERLIGLRDLAAEVLTGRGPVGRGVAPPRRLGRGVGHRRGHDRRRRVVLVPPPAGGVVVARAQPALARDRAAPGRPPPAGRAGDPGRTGARPPRGVPAHRGAARHRGPARRRRT